MNRAFLGLLIVAAGSLPAVCLAQTPASTPPGGYQPLSPTAVTVCLDGRHRVPANIVGQRVTPFGIVYDIDTRSGRRVVSAADLLGLPFPVYCPPRPTRHVTLPANVHRFR